MDPKLAFKPVVSGFKTHASKNHPQYKKARIQMLSSLVKGSSNRGGKRKKRQWCRGQGSSSGRLLEPGRTFRRPWRIAGIKKMKNERYQQGKVITVVTIYQVEPSTVGLGDENTH